MSLSMVLSRPVVSAALTLCLFAMLASSYSLNNVLCKSNAGSRSLLNGFPHSQNRRMRRFSTSLEALKEGAQEKIAALRMEYSELGESRTAFAVLCQMRL